MNKPYNRTIILLFWCNMALGVISLSPREPRIDDYAYYQSKKVDSLSEFVHKVHYNLRFIKETKNWERKYLLLHKCMKDPHTGMLEKTIYLIEKYRNDIPNKVLNEYINIALSTEEQKKEYEHINQE